MLGRLGKRRILLVQTSELASPLLDLEQRGFHGRDGHNVNADDVGPSKDSREVLLRSEVGLLYPDFLSTIRSDLVDRSRVAEEIDIAKKELAYRPHSGWITKTPYLCS